MTMEIRPATVDDAEALLALRHRLAKETDFTSWDPGEIQGTVEKQRDAIIAFDARGNSRYLLACDGEDLVGLILAAGGDRNRLRHRAVIALGILRSHWSRGIASRLLSEIIDWAPGAGVTRLTLEVNVTNVRAISLYLRHGFVFEGRHQGSMRINGAYVDDYAMALMLET
ncbi:MAG TPA: GNAT family N-acetyltransferase [Thermoanaerobaculia bacterium]|nr:GNAT family N-acetyltransferase [Thermoanaerobaculia bacterium]